MQVKFAYYYAKKWWMITGIVEAGGRAKENVIRTSHC